ncbi:MAG: hypothetical protein K2G83_08380, partial [Ruminococcus sp.]|nr:hypothetical protein [Ruminococcus sp.]
KRPLFFFDTNIINSKGISNLSCIIYKYHKNKKSFTHVLIIEGEGKIYSENVFNYNYDLKKGDSFFITAGSRWYITGKCSIIYTVI